MVGVGLLLNGSLRMHDDMWPFGPMSQYAFSPADGWPVVITRLEGQLADGRQVDFALDEASGTRRAEVETQVRQIRADPSLLEPLAQAWEAHHPGSVLHEVRLVQDGALLHHGLSPIWTGHELATWRRPG